MKKKIAILGSTGSIGKTLFNIIKKDKKRFDVVLLTTHKNYRELYKQASLFNVKNLIITDNESFNFFRPSKIFPPYALLDINKILFKKSHLFFVINYSFNKKSFNIFHSRY